MIGTAPGQSGGHIRIESQNAPKVFLAPCLQNQSDWPMRESNNDNWDCCHYYRSSVP